jgi:hypothetical protein
MAGQEGLGLAGPAHLSLLFLQVPLGGQQDHQKSVAATTAGADDAMPARRVKAIFGFLIHI